MSIDRNTPMHPDDRRTLGMSRAEAADYYAAQAEREAKEAAQEREVEAARESEAEPCDHDWKVCDESFDHAFGTEICICVECQKCGARKDYEPPSGPEE